MAQDSIIPIKLHLLAPKEGFRSLQYTVDLSNGAAIVDLVQVAMKGQMSQIPMVFVDNADNSFPIKLTMDGTLQRIVIPASSQGYVNLLLPQSPRLAFSSATPVSALKVNFLNFQVKEMIWSVGGTAAVTTAPTVTKLTAVGSGNYTPPVGCTRIEVELKGAGAGGTGTGTAGGPIAGGAGGDAIFAGYHATGGPSGNNNNFPAMGGANGANGAGAAWALSYPGEVGQAISLVPWSATTYAMYGGNGAGGGAGRTSINSNDGIAAQVNSGSGGGGAGFGPDTLGNLAANLSYGGGGAEAERRLLGFNLPVGPYAYTVPDGGTPGPAGTGGHAGGKGGSGYITITEYYN